MTIKENDLYFAKLRPDAIIPTKRDEDAGYDIYPCFDEDYMIIEPGETKLIPTGIASAFDKSKYIQIEERGSTGSKGIKKSAGVIDSGYRNQWFIAISNVTRKVLLISKLSEEEIMRKITIDCEVMLLKKDDDAEVVVGIGDMKTFFVYPYTKAIAQAVVHDVPVMDTKEITYEELMTCESERMTGGFGSSNK